MAKTLIIVLLFCSLLLIAGCDTKIKESDYEHMRSHLQLKGIEECKSHSMKFIALDMYKYGQADVYCQTISPIKIHKYGIKND
jgi:hypothetical protein